LARGGGRRIALWREIIRLLILTGQRRGEVAGMNWGEVTDDLTSWTLPGERTKHGVAHVVPLERSGSRRGLRGQAQAIGTKDGTRRHARLASKFAAISRKRVLYPIALAA
jgi:integrase